MKERLFWHFENGWNWLHFVQMAIWPWASTVRIADEHQMKHGHLSVYGLVNTKQLKQIKHNIITAGTIWYIYEPRHKWIYTCTHSVYALTFAVWFEISVHRWGLAVTRHWPARRGLGTGAETHVGGWGDLLSKRGELHGARGHGHIVGFMHGLRQTARVMMWWRVGTHGDIVLVYLFCGLATYWHHSFVFLKVTRHTYMFVLGLY